MVVTNIEKEQHYIFTKQENDISLNIGKIGIDNEEMKLFNIINNKNNNLQIEKIKMSNNSITNLNVNLVKKYIDFEDRIYKTYSVVYLPHSQRINDVNLDTSSNFLFMDPDGHTDVLQDLTGKLIYGKTYRFVQFTGSNKKITDSEGFHNDLVFLHGDNENVNLGVPEIPINDRLMFNNNYSVLTDTLYSNKNLIYKNTPSPYQRELIWTINDLTKDIINNDAKRSDTGAVVDTFIDSYSNHVHLKYEFTLDLSSEILSKFNVSTNNYEELNDSSWNDFSEIFTTILDKGENISILLSNVDISSDFTWEVIESNNLNNPINYSNYKTGNNELANTVAINDNNNLFGICIKRPTIIRKKILIESQKETKSIIIGNSSELNDKIYDLVYDVSSGLTFGLDYTNIDNRDPLFDENIEPSFNSAFSGSKSRKFNLNLNSITNNLDLSPDISGDIISTWNNNIWWNEENKSSVNEITKVYLNDIKINVVDASFVNITSKLQIESKDTLNNKVEYKYLYYNDTQDVSFIRYSNMHHNYVTPLLTNDKDKASNIIFVIKNDFDNTLLDFSNDNINSSIIFNLTGEIDFYSRKMNNENDKKNVLTIDSDGNLDLKNNNIINFNKIIDNEKNELQPGHYVKAENNLDMNSRDIENIKITHYQNDNKICTYKDITGDNILDKFFFPNTNEWETSNIEFDQLQVFGGEYELYISGGNPFIKGSNLGVDYEDKTYKECNLNKLHFELCKNRWYRFNTSGIDFEINGINYISKTDYGSFHTYIYEINKNIANVKYNAKLILNESEYISFDIHISSEVKVKRLTLARPKLQHIKANINYGTDANLTDMLNNGIMYNDDDESMPTLYSSFSNEYSKKYLEGKSYDLEGKSYDLFSKIRAIENTKDTFLSSKDSILWNTPNNINPGYHNFSNEWNRKHVYTDELEWRHTWGIPINDDWSEYNVNKYNLTSSDNLKLTINGFENNVLFKSWKNWGVRPFYLDLENESINIDSTLNNNYSNKTIYNLPTRKNIRFTAGNSFLNSVDNTDITKNGKKYDIDNFFIDYGNLGPLYFDSDNTNYNIKKQTNLSHVYQFKKTEHTRIYEYNGNNEDKRVNIVNIEIKNTTDILDKTTLPDNYQTSGAKYDDSLHNIQTDSNSLESRLTSTPNEIYSNFWNSQKAMIRNDKYSTGDISGFNFMPSRNDELNMNDSDKNTLYNHVSNLPFDTRASLLNGVVDLIDIDKEQLYDSNSFDCKIRFSVTDFSDNEQTVYLAMGYNSILGGGENSNYFDFNKAYIEEKKTLPIRYEKSPKKLVNGSLVWIRTNDLCDPGTTTHGKREYFYLNGFRLGNSTDNIAWVTPNNLKQYSNISKEREAYRLHPWMIEFVKQGFGSDHLEENFRNNGDKPDGVGLFNGFDVRFYTTKFDVSKNTYVKDIYDAGSDKFAKALYLGCGFEHLADLSNDHLNVHRSRMTIYNCTKLNDYLDANDNLSNEKLEEYNNYQHYIDKGLLGKIKYNNDNPYSYDRRFSHMQSQMGKYILRNMSPDTSDPPSIQLELNPNLNTGFNYDNSLNYSNLKLKSDTIDITTRDISYAGFWGISDNSYPNSGGKAYQRSGWPNHFISDVSFNYDSTKSKIRNNKSSFALDNLLYPVGGEYLHYEQAAVELEIRDINITNVNLYNTDSITDDNSYNVAPLSRFRLFFDESDQNFHGKSVYICSFDSNFEVSETQTYTRDLRHNDVAWKVYSGIEPYVRRKRSDMKDGYVHLLSAAATRSDVNKDNSLNDVDSLHLYNESRIKRNEAGSLAGSLDDISSVNMVYNLPYSGLVDYSTIENKLGSDVAWVFELIDPRVANNNLHTVPDDTIQKYYNLSEKDGKLEIDNTISGEKMKPEAHNLKYPLENAYAKVLWTTDPTEATRFTVTLPLMTKSFSKGFQYKGANHVFTDKNDNAIMKTTTNNDINLLKNNIKNVGEITDVYNNKYLKSEVDCEINANNNSITNINELSGFGNVIKVNSKLSLSKNVLDALYVTSETVECKKMICEEIEFRCKSEPSKSIYMSLENYDRNIDASNANDNSNNNSTGLQNTTFSMTNNFGIANMVVNNTNLLVDGVCGIHDNLSVNGSIFSKLQLVTNPGFSPYYGDLARDDDLNIKTFYHSDNNYFLNHYSAIHQTYLNETGKPQSMFDYSHTSEIGNGGINLNDLNLDSVYFKVMATDGSDLTTSVYWNNHDEQIMHYMYQSSFFVDTNNDFTKGFKIIVIEELSNSTTPPKSTTNTNREYKVRIMVNGSSYLRHRYQDLNNARYIELDAGTESANYSYWILEVLPNGRIKLRYGKACIIVSPLTWSESYSGFNEYVELTDVNALQWQNVINGDSTSYDYFTFDHPHTSSTSDSTKGLEFEIMEYSQVAKDSNWDYENVLIQNSSYENVLIQNSSYTTTADVDVRITNQLSVIESRFLQLESNVDAATAQNQNELATALNNVLASSDNAITIRLAELESLVETISGEVDTIQNSGAGSVNEYAVNALINTALDTHEQNHATTGGGTGGGTGTGTGTGTDGGGIFDISILNSNIGDVHIKSDANIDGSKIKHNTITDDQIKSDANIDGSKIRDSTISGEKLADSSVSLRKLNVDVQLKTVYDFSELEVGEIYTKISFKMVKLNNIDFTDDLYLTGYSELNNPNENVVGPHWYKNGDGIITADYPPQFTWSSTSQVYGQTKLYVLEKNEKNNGDTDLYRNILRDYLFKIKILQKLSNTRCVINLIPDNSDYNTWVASKGFLAVFGFGDQPRSGIGLPTTSYMSDLYFYYAPEDYLNVGYQSNAQGNIFAAPNSTHDTYPHHYNLTDRMILNIDNSGYVFIEYPDLPNNKSWTGQYLRGAGSYTNKKMYDLRSNPTGNPDLALKFRFTTEDEDTGSADKSLPGLAVGHAFSRTVEVKYIDDDETMGGINGNLITYGTITADKLDLLTTTEIVYDFSELQENVTYKNFALRIHSIYNQEPKMSANMEKWWLYPYSSPGGQLSIKRQPNIHKAIDIYLKNFPNFEDELTADGPMYWDIKIIKKHSNTICSVYLIPSGITEDSYTWAFGFSSEGEQNSARAYFSTLEEINDESTFHGSSERNAEMLLNIDNNGYIYIQYANNFSDHANNPDDALGGNYFMFSGDYIEIILRQKWASAWQGGISSEFRSTPNSDSAVRFEFINKVTSGTGSNPIPYVPGQRAFSKEVKVNQISSGIAPKGIHARAIVNNSITADKLDLDLMFEDIADFSELEVGQEYDNVGFKIVSYDTTTVDTTSGVDYYFTANASQGITTENPHQHLKVMKSTDTSPNAPQNYPWNMKIIKLINNNKCIVTLKRTNFLGIGVGETNHLSVFATFFSTDAGYKDATSDIETIYLILHLDNSGNVYFEYPSLGDSYHWAGLYIYISDRNDTNMGENNDDVVRSLENAWIGNHKTSWEIKNRVDYNNMASLNATGDPDKALKFQLVNFNTPTKSLPPTFKKTRTKTQISTSTSVYNQVHARKILDGTITKKQVARESITLDRLDMNPVNVLSTDFTQLSADNSYNVHFKIAKTNKEYVVENDTNYYMLSRDDNTASDSNPGTTPIITLGMNDFVNNLGSYQLSNPATTSHWVMDIIEKPNPDENRFRITLRSEWHGDEFYFGFNSINGDDTNIQLFSNKLTDSHFTNNLKTYQMFLNIDNEQYAYIELSNTNRSLTDSTVTNTVPGMDKFAGKFLKSRFTDDRTVTQNILSKTPQTRDILFEATSDRDEAIKFELNIQGLTVIKSLTLASVLSGASSNAETIDIQKIEGDMSGETELTVTSDTGDTPIEFTIEVFNEVTSGTTKYKWKGLDKNYLATGKNPNAQTEYPTIVFIRGKSYRLILSGDYSSHPINIQTALWTTTYSNTLDYNVITNSKEAGVNGYRTGVLEFTVPENEVYDKLYYQCAHHRGMSGEILIESPSKLYLTYDLTNLNFVVDSDTLHQLYLTSDATKAKNVDLSSSIVINNINETVVGGGISVVDIQEIQGDISGLIELTVNSDDGVTDFKKLYLTYDYSIFHFFTADTSAVYPLYLTSVEELANNLDLSSSISIKNPKMTGVGSGNENINIQELQGDMNGTTEITGEYLTLNSVYFKVMATDGSDLTALVYWSRRDFTRFPGSMIQSKHFADPPDFAKGFEIIIIEEITTSSLTSGGNGIKLTTNKEYKIHIKFGDSYLYSQVTDTTFLLAANQTLETDSYFWILEVLSNGRIKLRVGMAGPSVPELSDTNSSFNQYITIKNTTVWNEVIAGTAFAGSFSVGNNGNIGPTSDPNKALEFEIMEYSQAAKDSNWDYENVLIQYQYTQQTTKLYLTYNYDISSSIGDVQEIIQDGLIHYWNVTPSYDATYLLTDSHGSIDATINQRNSDSYIINGNFTTNDSSKGYVSIPAGNWIELNSDISFDIGTSSENFTLFIGVSFETLAFNYYGIAGYDNTDNKKNIILYRGNPNQIQFTEGLQEFTADIDITHPLISSKWYVFCITFNNNNVNLYINDTNVGQSTLSVSESNDSIQFKKLLYGFFSNERTHTGVDFAFAGFYNRALSQDEVFENYRVHAKRFEEIYYSDINKSKIYPLCFTKNDKIKKTLDFSSSIAIDDINEIFPSGGLDGSKIMENTIPFSKLKIESVVVQNSITINDYDKLQPGSNFDNVKFKVIGTNGLGFSSSAPAADYYMRVQIHSNNNGELQFLTTTEDSILTDTTNFRLTVLEVIKPNEKYKVMLGITGGTTNEWFKTNHKNLIDNVNLWYLKRQTWDTQVSYAGNSQFYLNIKANGTIYLENYSVDGYSDPEPRIFTLTDSRFLTKNNLSVSQGAADAVMFSFTQQESKALLFEVEIPGVTDVQRIITDRIMVRDESTDYNALITALTSRIVELEAITIKVLSPVDAVFTVSSDGNTIYEYTVPLGYDRISVVAVGGGGGGEYSQSQGGNGGAGGSLAYMNDIIVTEGDVISVTVGIGGVGGPAAAGGSNGGNGGNSVVALNDAVSTTITARGGGGGLSNNVGVGQGITITNSPPGTTSGGASGGLGGNRNNPAGGGGGGAGGYTGLGGGGSIGRGEVSIPSTPSAAGGYGSGAGGIGYHLTTVFAGGGGEGGQTTNAAYPGGGGGANLFSLSYPAEDGRDANPGMPQFGSEGGFPGGGGGGGKQGWVGKNGANGAVRIVAYSSKSIFSASFPTSSTGGVGNEVGVLF